MAQYRIIGTVQIPVACPSSHKHLVRVQIGNPSGRTEMWTMDDVYAAMDKGDSFYTQGEESGKIALVQRMKCPHCKTFKMLQSAPDATEENNLDNLPTGNTG